jgi:hypothetical protein
MEADPQSMVFALPFILSGALKVVYDFLLFFSFRGMEKV